MMIRINLLPHREERREAKKKEFNVVMGVFAAVGIGVVVAGGMFINGMISSQDERNQMVRTANQALENEIKEIATLETEIASLRARQQAVENLQQHRTLPVHMFDELVRMMPEGTFLRELRQEKNRVTLMGYAQSNDRVADLLRNLSTQSEWMEKPQLDEIKEVAMPDKRAGSGATPDSRKVYEFALNVLLKSNTPAVDPAAAEQAAAAAGSSQVLAAAAQQGSSVR